MLRCGLPSEKDEGRKVSSDFVRLFSGKHAATVQCGCMWYYNYAMYILQCVIILHKTTACGFSSNEGGCCWVKKNWGKRETSETLERSSSSRRRSYVCEFIRGVGGRGYVELTGFPPASILPLLSCTRAYITVLYLRWTACVSGYKLHMQPLLLRHKEKQQDFIFPLLQRKPRCECMYAWMWAHNNHVYTLSAAVLLYTPQLCRLCCLQKGIEVWHLYALLLLQERHVSSCNTRRYLHHT